jgi:hypothetical protein
LVENDDGMKTKTTAIETRIRKLNQEKGTQKDRKNKTKKQYGRGCKETKRGKRERKEGNKENKQKKLKIEEN